MADNPDHLTSCLASLLPSRRAAAAAAAAAAGPAARRSAWGPDGAAADKGAPPPSAAAAPAHPPLPQQLLLESDPGVALRRRVVEVMTKMLTTPASACRPAGSEAQRILGFFINSLSNPQLTKPSTLVRVCACVRCCCRCGWCTCVEALVPAVPATPALVAVEAAGCHPLIARSRCETPAHPHSLHEPDPRMELTVSVDTEKVV
jgi:hypothetical protein